MNTMRQLLNTFLARFVFPFSHLICLFVDHLGGEAGVSTLL